MKFNKEKFAKIFYPTFYFLFAIGVAISGSFIFQKFYYTNIYISGVSMNPTLLGEPTRCHYGIADTSQAAINSLNRFDVIITYYSWNGEDSTLKVKRVWGFPGETLSLKRVVMEKDTENEHYGMQLKVNGEVVIYSSANHPYKMTCDYPASFNPNFNVYTFNAPNKTFSVNVDYPNNSREFDFTLGSDEYFVMGDNWWHSSDCYGNGSSKNLHGLKRKDIQGKVIRIEGTAKYSSEVDGLIDKLVYKDPIYNF